MWQIFGSIREPAALARFGGVTGGGIGKLLNLVLNVMIVAGGVYALFNFVLAGYGFLSAGDDSKAIASAWARIWQTGIGLAFLAGSFVLAAIFGYLIFGAFNAILSPTIPGL